MKGNESRRTNTGERTKSGDGDDARRDFKKRILMIIFHRLGIRSKKESFAII
jgi:hypothetical protein